MARLHAGGYAGQAVVTILAVFVALLAIACSIQAIEAAPSSSRYANPVCVPDCLPNSG